MPLGDSITLGYPTSDGYRNNLWYKLQETNYNIDFVGSQNNGSATNPSFDINHEGYGFFKTFDLAEIIYDKLEENQADVILLHAGSNDVSPTQGVNSSSISGLEDILNEIDYYEIAYTHPITVLLATIIDRRSSHSTVTAYNNNLKNMAQRRIDNGDKIIFVSMKNDANLQVSDYADATHPNSRGYAKMATVWFDALQPTLETLHIPNPLIQPFVERFYTTILDRPGKSTGIDYWVRGLDRETLAAANIARGFIFSDEFEARNLDNVSFIEILYSGFFDRTPDDNGLNYWVQKLDDGETKFTVLNGFLYSQEFHLLAQSYNILTIFPSEFFVSRFYTKALERTPEEEGFSYWANQLQTDKSTASDIAKAFFFSEEYINKNVTNETYLLTLYRTLLDREADLGGLSQWTLKLEEGLSREDVLNSFIKSPEFKNLSKSYNIRL